MVHMWAWPGASLRSGPLWCDNKDFRLQKPHPLIVGNERGVVGLHANQLTSLMWLRFCIPYLPPPFQCTTLSLWAYLLLAVSIGIKHGYVASCRAWHSRLVIAHTGNRLHERIG